LRTARGFTQERFSEASGFTQRYISGLERGRRNPTIVTVFELATALGVSHIDLLIPDDDARSERSKSSKRK
jgi:transcriptional regulator with XRE-family HTH domain